MNNNPILNNPDEPPQLHYATEAKDGSLNYNDKRKGRRIFTRQAQVIPTKQIQASLLELNDTASDEDHNHIINILRKEVADWRSKGYPDVTRVSQSLLNYWFKNPRIMSQSAPPRLRHSFTASFTAWRLTVPNCGPMWK
jgi:hypothetical protein